ncbi:hypothetical protein EI94DRAFT_1721409, partial [Lactarius quietus]
MQSRIIVTHRPPPSMLSLLRPPLPHDQPIVHGVGARVREGGRSGCLRAAPSSCAVNRHTQTSASAPRPNTAVLVVVAPTPTPIPATSRSRKENGRGVASAHCGETRRRGRDARPQRGRESTISSLALRADEDFEARNADLEVKANVRKWALIL